MTRESLLYLFNLREKSIHNSALAITQTSSLGLEDVKRHFDTILSAHTNLEKPIQEPFKSLYVANVQDLSEALKVWDIDKSHLLMTALALIFVVADPNHITEDENPEQAEALCRCAIVLAQEPLIPPLDKEKYRQRYQRARAAMKGAAEDKVAMISVYLTYLAAVSYNTMKFCPEVFEEEITQMDVEFFRKKFFENLERLSGKPPFIH